MLVHIFGHHSEQSSEALTEFQQLALAVYEGKIEQTLSVHLRQFNPKTLLGAGKVVEIQQLVANLSIKLVIIDHELSPSQERNLEQAIKARVLDRTGLILEIFAARARTFEGRLQVELAQLEHLSTRLVRGWSHLERQRGGIGLRGGPGETQLEVDRRILRERIQYVKQRLEKVRKQRALSRRARQRKNLPLVALVGYTNAGKSTLFNALTHSKVFMADKLFATLDPTLRRIYVPDFGKMIFADTVGFIRDLPHQLIDAFHATLEETLEADLLLHVIDASSPQKTEMIKAVHTVLEEIGADKIPMLEIYNKIDKAGKSIRIDFDSHRQPKRVWLSALTAEGIVELKEALVEFFAGAKNLFYENVSGNE